MKRGMTRAARAEITNAVRERYRSAAGKAKRRILDEFIAVTGYHEKSAIRVLNSVPSAMVRQRRHRPTVYDGLARPGVSRRGRYINAVSETRVF